MTFVYVCGPIAGKPDANRQAFKDACLYLTHLGYEPVNPHDIGPYDHEGLCPEGPLAGEGGTHAAPCYMRSDLKALLECDAIFMLHGWMYSVGARTEFEVARACGLKLFFEEHPVRLHRQEET